MWEEWEEEMVHVKLPYFEVRALPGCAKDDPGCKDMVLVTIDPGVGLMP